jgi:dihydrofolate reductase
MGKVLLNVSMSLDGYIAGPNHSVSKGMGEGGERLHYWMFQGAKTHAINAGVVKEIFDTSGAFLMGRRWFDHGEKVWGASPFNMPVFVVTHRMRETVISGNTTFHFITDGIESAVRQAKAAAGDKNVTTGGADLPRQLLKSGLVDEIQISLVPVLLGNGIPLFDATIRKHIELERISTIEAPDVTHIRFRVIKNGQ